jgi:hypothetical protein
MPQIKKIPIKRWIFLFIILLIGIVGYWGYQRFYEDPENRIGRIVNDASSRVFNGLSYEIEDSIEESKIKYADLFNSLETQLAGISNDISELQKIKSPEDSIRERGNAAVNYVQICHQVLKAEYDKYIKLREYTEALKTISIKETAITVNEDVNIKESEYKKAKEEFAIALRKLSEVYDRSVKSIGKESLVDRQIIEKTIRKYQKDQ